MLAWEGNLLPPVWLVSRRDSGPSWLPVAPHWGLEKHSSLYTRSSMPRHPRDKSCSLGDPCHTSCFFSIHLANSARRLTGTPPWGAGRASASPLVDLFVTLLTMGRRTFTRLIEDRAVRRLSAGTKLPPSSGARGGGQPPPSLRDPPPQHRGPEGPPRDGIIPSQGIVFSSSFLSRFYATDSTVSSSP